MDMDNSPQEKKSFLVEVEPFLARNETRKVLEMAQSRLNEIPEDLDARIAICRVWLQQGRIDEARTLLQEIEEILAGLSLLYSCMGDIYKKKGLETEAGIFYRKFAALHPAAPGQDEAGRLERIAEFAAADVAGEESEEGETEIPAGFETATLAELYLGQGHPEMAKELLEKIISREPDNERARGLLEKVCALREQGKGAPLNTQVIAELSRWLGNIGKLRNRAI